MFSYFIKITLVLLLSPSPQSCKIIFNLKTCQSFTFILTSSSSCFNILYCTTPMSTSKFGQQYIAPLLYFCGAYRIIMWFSLGICRVVIGQGYIMKCTLLKSGTRHTSQYSSVSINILWVAQERPSKIKKSTNIPTSSFLFRIYFV